MLIATVTFLMITFGGGSDHWGMPQYIDANTKQADEFVMDEGRKQEAQSVIETIRTEYQTFVANVSRQRQEFAATDSNHDATEEDYQAIFDKLDSEWIGFERRLVELEAELKQHITEDEWNAMFVEIKKDWK